MENFKDESFISQYLSPKLMRDMKLFNIHDNESDSFVEISAIHNEAGYKEIRRKLSEQYNFSLLESNIQITEADVDGDRSLTLCYTSQNKVPLANSYKEVLKHIYYLWRFDVKLVEEFGYGERKTLSQCPEPQKIKRAKLALF